MEDAKFVEDALARLRQEFARQTADIPDEIVGRCHPWNLAEPCQVFDIWSEVDDCHDITIVRHPDATGRIVVKGPLDPTDIFPAMEAVLQDPIWNNQAPRDPDFWPASSQPVEPGKVTLLRHVQTNHYGSLLKQISGMLFHKRLSQGHGSYGETVPGLLHMQWFGSLSTIEPAETVRRMISQAQHDHQSYLEYLEHKASSPQEEPAPYNEPASDGMWTCLHPSLAIGPQPEKTIWSVFTTSTRGLHNIPRRDIHPISSTGFHYTREGYVLVEGGEPRRIRQALNHLVFLLNSEGIPTKPIGPNDLAKFIFEKTGNQSGAFSTTYQVPDPFRNHPTGIFGFDSGFGDGGSRYVDQAHFGALLASAWQLSASPWANEVEWLMDAQAHVDEGRHSPALLTAWQGIERIVYRVLDGVLEQTGTPEPVRRRIAKGRYSDAIRLANEIAVEGIPPAASLGSLNDARNKVAHGSMEATSEQATEGIEALRKLLAPLVSRELSALAQSKPTSSS